MVDNETLRQKRVKVSVPILHTFAKNSSTIQNKRNCNLLRFRCTNLKAYRWVGLVKFRICLFVCRKVKAGKFIKWKSSSRRHCGENLRDTYKTYRRLHLNIPHTLKLKFYKLIYTLKVANMYTYMFYCCVKSNLLKKQDICQTCVKSSMFIWYFATKRKRNFLTISHTFLVNGLFVCSLLIYIVHWMYNIWHKLRTVKLNAFNFIFGKKATYFFCISELHIFLKKRFHPHK